MSKRVVEYMESISDIVVTADTSVKEAMVLYLAQRAAGIIVTDTRRQLRGIFTGTDIVSEINRESDSLRMMQGTMDFLMTKNVETVPENTLMIDAVDILYKRRIHSLVVTKGFTPVGLLTQWSVAQWWMDEHRG